jgi:hypothetical protein
MVHPTGSALSSDEQEKQAVSLHPVAIPYFVAINFCSGLGNTHVSSCQVSNCRRHRRTQHKLGVRAYDAALSRGISFMFAPWVIAQPLSLRSKVAFDSVEDVCRPIVLWRRTDNQPDARYSNRETTAGHRPLRNIRQHQPCFSCLPSCQVEYGLLNRYFASLRPRSVPSLR